MRVAAASRSTESIPTCSPGGNRVVLQNAGWGNEC